MPNAISNSITAIRNGLIANPNEKPDLKKYGLFGGLFYKVAKNSLQTHPPAQQPTHQPPVVPAGPPQISPMSTQTDSPITQTPPIIMPQTQTNDVQAFQGRQINNSVQGGGSFWQNALRKRPFGNVQATPFGRSNPWLG